MLSSLHVWLDTVFVNDTTSAHLVLAMLLGSAIGLERQWRQRSAGLRTTVLVCIGSASFVDLAGAIAPNTTGVTQVIAYVVSGVGFLGAGAIMREGATVRGLNTAATVWCSAAVGASAGAGEVNGALATTIAVIFMNMMIRPIEGFVAARQSPSTPTEEAQGYRVTALCLAEAAAEARMNLLRDATAAGLVITGVAGEMDQDGRVELRIDLTSRSVTEVEALTGRLRLGTGIETAGWRQTGTN